MNAISLYKRDAEGHLLQWKDRSSRRPLILRGARQVGKSSLVRIHAASYEFFVEYNLELNSDRRLFETVESVDSIIERISLLPNYPGTLDNTLLFIDEIQEVPDAILMLRFFFENYPNLRVIAAGSLLEFALGEVRSFPVGRVEFYSLHPLSFAEYLTWNKKDSLRNVLEGGEFSPVQHELLLEAFHAYALIGGMPGIVGPLANGAQLGDVTPVFDGIWAAYKTDVEKYALNARQLAVLRHLMHVAPYADDRIKYTQFGDGRFRSEEISEGFNLLGKAGIMRLIFPTTAIQIPFTPAIKRAPRIQFLDTGLLNWVRDVQHEMLEIDDLFAGYKGRLASHIVTQELIARQNGSEVNIHFWVREKAGASAEVDALLHAGSKTYGLEVKAGAQGRLRSLHEFLERSDSKVAFRALRNQLSVEQATTARGYGFTLINLPYYAVGYWERILERMA